ncbi:MAG: alpha/beta hydrolase [Rhodospirillaceae bacterium]|nr:alpha/beta hydrolase [Rhodospirillaceae bacterium]
MFEFNGRTIDFVESGNGPLVLFVPGSFSTPAAWRPIQKQLPNGYRFITTSVCGYGATEETRSLGDVAITHQTRLVEAVVIHAGGGPVHLVGHSMGGMICFATAMEGRVDVSSIAAFEANPLELVRENAGEKFYQAIRNMSDEYEAAYLSGEEDAARRIIDFWGREGDFAAMPQPVRAYCKATTWSNILDWRAAFNFHARKADYATLEIPVLAVRGSECNPVMVNITDALHEAVPNIHTEIINNAGHFLITSHPSECAVLLRNFLSNLNN